MLPFSNQDFFAVFASYNESIWPLQWALIGIAAAVVIMSLSASRLTERVISAALGFLWAWMAVLYHLVWFTQINPAAYLFAGAFLVEAAAFLWWSIRGLRLEISYRLDPRTAVGIGMLAYALGGYPALSAALGHEYPSSPSFGVPCPTTIFTLGLLALSRARKAVALCVVPLLWSLVGGSAALFLGVWQDLGLIVGGVVMAVLSVAQLRRRHSRSEPVD